MKITPKHYAKLLLEITKDKKNIDSSLEKFIVLLKRNRDTRLLSKILNEFIIHFNAEHSIQPVIAYFSNAPEVNIFNNIKKFLKDEIQTANVELIAKHDTSLIGGIKLRIEDLIIDGTIKNKINKLKQALIS